MAVGVTVEDDPTYTHFAHRNEFVGLLGQLLEVDVQSDPSDDEDEREVKLVDALEAILDYYLPQPGLLDPSLHEIIPPLMEAIAFVVTLLTTNPNPSNTISRKRLSRLGQVVNWIVKVRGWKAVVPYFSSTISFLIPLIQLLSPAVYAPSAAEAADPHYILLSGQDMWEIRAVLLLWLTLLLSVPFDLAALNEASNVTGGGLDLAARRLLFPSTVSETARDITMLALPLLHRPGKEGSYAALLLVRLFTRSDGVPGLGGFFSWAARELHEGERESEHNFVASLLELLAALPSSMPYGHLGQIQAFTDDVLFTHLRGSRTASSSGLVRKLAVKAKGRWWIAALKQLKPGADLPGGLEEHLGNLMSSLGDKDTIVRYSSAKYLARLSALLRTDLSRQMVGATVQLFAGTDDEPVVETPYGLVIDPGGTDASDGTMGLGGLELTRGEARWHGTCLAMAEMARRALLPDDVVAEVVHWALKALTFDLRKASHSVGANVRDAAAYLIWSLSRACPSDIFAPFAEILATRLVCVACFDREVGVRRAASAAFQEGVGRLGMYPEGIDVLGHTDFYSVSVRRMAFHNAAPAVSRSCRGHCTYRNAMIQHLHEVTLRHWDATMQQLGSDALVEMLKRCDSQFLEDSIQVQLQVLSSLDSVHVRGALYALGGICLLLPVDSATRAKIIENISRLRPAILVSSQAHEILQATAHLIAGCLSTSNIDHPVTQELYAKYRDANMRRKEPECHAAAADLAGRLSQLREVSQDIDCIVADLKSGTASQRQAAALVLGSISYRLNPVKVPVAVESLLYQLDADAKADVETRRAAVTSLAAVCVQKSETDELLVTSSLFQKCHAAFVKALDDYSTDQRGDVGSWVRIAGIAALAKTMNFAAGRKDATGLVSQSSFSPSIGGLVKQGVEKLEPVRAEVWRTIVSLRAATVNEIWQWEGSSVWEFEADQLSDEAFRYISQEDWYTSAMPLLRTRYRSSLVAGLVQSIGSSISSSADLVLKALLQHLAPTSMHLDTIIDVYADLEALMRNNFASNRVFVPVTNTATKLVSSTISREVLLSPRGEVFSDRLSKVIEIASKSISTLKSVERITSVASFVIAMVILPEARLRREASAILPRLLTHRFPRIRTITAERLYLALSEEMIDMDEELEDVLLSTDWGNEASEGEKAKQVAMLCAAGIMI